MNIAPPTTDANHQAFRNAPLHENIGMACRRRILARFEEERRDHALTRPCPSCGMPLLSTENDSWDCCDGKRRHWPWPNLPPEMVHLLAAPGFGNLSRILNSMFAMCVITAEKGEGFSIHVGGGAPMMRVNGQLYSKMSRRSEHCWFFVDSTFDPYYKSLTKKELTFVISFRDVLRNYNSRINHSISTFAHPDDGETFPFQENPSQSEILGQLYVWKTLCQLFTLVPLEYLHPARCM